MDLLISSHAPDSVTADQCPIMCLTTAWLHFIIPPNTSVLNQSCHSWRHSYSQQFTLNTSNEKGTRCCTHSPEFDEVLGDCRTNDQAVEWTVGQEQDEELVVWEANTVIYPEQKHVKLRETEGGAWFSLLFKDELDIPGAVMVHFQHTPGQIRKTSCLSLRSSLFVSYGFNVSAVTQNS